MILPQIFPYEHHNIFITPGKAGTAQTDLHFDSQSHFITVQK
jgi:hypothetical protein